MKIKLGTSHKYSYCEETGKIIREDDNCAMSDCGKFYHHTSPTYQKAFDKEYEWLGMMN